MLVPCKIGNEADNKVRLSRQFTFSPRLRLIALVVRCLTVLPKAWNIMALNSLCNQWLIRGYLQKLDSDNPSSAID